MNIVQNRTQAQRELRNALKMARNFEILHASLNKDIAGMHYGGLKSARAELRRAREGVARARKLVRLRIKVLKAKHKI
jgi:hypothetical protein